MDEARLPELIRALYAIVQELETMFPGRRFTPDGHLVGSLGECLAAYHYGLELLPMSVPCHDASCDDRLVQVKATQGRHIGLRANPEYLLALRLDGEGGFEEIYNGLGQAVWDLVREKPMPSNGQYQIGVTALRRLADLVPMELRLPRLTRERGQ
jgi:hypothetical protein